MSISNTLFTQNKYQPTYISPCLLTIHQLMVPTLCYQQQNGPKIDNYFQSINDIVSQKMHMPYTASTDDDDEPSAEVNFRIIINGIWTDRR